MTAGPPLPPAVGAPLPPTVERIWCAYLAAVVAVALATPGGGMAGHRVGLHLLAHAAVAAMVLATWWGTSRWPPAVVRTLRILVGLAGLGVVFSAMGLLLPAVHPEPFEYLWAEMDVAVFGMAATRCTETWLGPWIVEALQIVYAAFYFIPLIAAFGALRGSGIVALDRAVVLLIGGFLASYLGYLLVPTLAPKVVLAHSTPVEGWWLTPWLREAIDRAELNRWDCFPSGHTMLSLVSLVVLWRWRRAWFWPLAAAVTALIASTVLLRYHWPIDVLAGALLVWPAVWFGDLLMARDGWGAPAPDREASAAQPVTG